MTTIPGLVRTVRTTLGALSRSAAFAYTALLLLQLKVVWGMWSYRDLTSGDTASYFMSAVRWSREFAGNFVSSPLYTAFYGSFLVFSDDPYVATIGHRLVIVFALAILLLAVLRRLLPGAIAWFVAAWWVVLPINFDALYEVHLFALVLPLLGVLVAVDRPDAWGRGATLAILLVSAALVRSELILACFCWAGACVVWERRRARAADIAPGGSPVGAYLMPLVGAALAVFVFYGRSTYTFPELVEHFHRKHTLNFGQIYAFNHLRQNHDWRGSPWTDYRDLMRRDFAAADPGMMEALRSNAPAVAKEFLGNLRVLPTSIQLLLFDRASGRINPKYVPFHRDVLVARGWSTLVAVLITIGTMQFRKTRSRWWNCWLKERVWGWIALGCLAVAALFTAILATPRPSFIFPLGIFLMAITGMSAFVIAARWKLLRRLSVLMPVAAVILIALWPCHYDSGYDNVRGFQGRPLLTSVRRLSPLGEMLARPGTRLLAWRFSSDLCAYVARSHGCEGLDFNPSILGRLDRDSLVAWLAERRVTHLYADHHVLADAGRRRLLLDLGNAGWRVLGASPDGGQTWQLLGREAVADGERLKAPLT